jgi:hypothetical protein
MTIAKGKYEQTVGSRAQVWHGTAYRTSGGLTKSALMMSHGRVVSVKKHNSAKREKRLEKAGYFTKKGKFGFVRKSVMSRGKSRKSRSMKGGDPTHPDAPSTMPPYTGEPMPPDTTHPDEFNSLPKSAPSGGRRRSRRRKHRGGSRLEYSSFK